MAIIHPFKGWVPKADLAKEISSVPYDVINTEEAREMAEGNPGSFLHVIRPEIDLPEGTPFNDDKVYDKGAENLEAYLGSDAVSQDSLASVYIYQLEAWGRTQTGIFTCVSVEDYDKDVILKHELTRPDKEDDRTRHILSQSAHAEPVMLTFKDTAGVTEFMNRAMAESRPRIAFRSDDDVWHRIWNISSSEELVKAFEKISNLYVADGHHRCKSASRASETLRKKNGTEIGSSEYDFFTAVLFPMNQMKILPYNRVIRTVTPEQLSELQSRFKITENGNPSPSKRGEVSVYFDGSWHSMILPAPKNDNIVEQLDVTRLQESVLSPVFHIENPRTDSNIDFVGGIRGTGELEKLVENGSADLAFSMYPTAIEELVDVSDKGMLMPPKSTWFEPKIRSGLIIHTF